MQVIERFLQTIAQHLRGLSASNKLLIGSLMIIMVMALFIVSLYTGRARLVPLPVNLTGADRIATIDYLNRRQITWAEQDGQLVVPQEQRHVLLAELTEAKVISPNQIDFNELVKQDSPFLSKAQHDRQWMVAKMNHLGRTISLMQGIKRADVVIDEPRRAGGIGVAHISPSASVNVITSGESLTQAQVNAIAAMVAGAQADLDRRRVEVIDARAGKVLKATTEDRLLAGRYLELQKSTTAVYEAKLSKALAFIPGVNVALNVIVDPREVVEETRRVDDPKQGVTRESTRNLASNSLGPSREPGVRSNTGVTIGQPGGRTSTMNDERSETSLVPAFGGSDSRTHDPGGYALRINASVGVPRSYFVRLYREEVGDDAAEPTAAELDPLRAREIERIRTHVQPLVDTGPKGDPAQGSVVVSMIPDFAAPVVAGEETAAGGGMPGGLVSETMVKYVSLGFLALLSVLMMFLMVRRTGAVRRCPRLRSCLACRRLWPACNRRTSAKPRAPIRRWRAWRSTRRRCAAGRCCSSSTRRLARRRTRPRPSCAAGSGATPEGFARRT